MKRPAFVDHLVFRVSDLERTERFYSALLDEPPDRAEDSTMFCVGDTRLFFTCAAGPSTLPYEKEKVGLNHIAFGARTIEELRAIEARINRRGISHSGIQIDRYGGKEFIWLDDPDGIRIEFYLRGEE
jgi:glyoxylase I family protein